MAKQTRLLPRQRRFCFNVIIKGMNYYQAALDAKYSKAIAINAGNALVSNKFIQNEMVRLRKELEEKAMLDKEWVLRKHKFTVDKMIDEAKDDLKAIDAHVGIKALSEISKMQGYYHKEDKDAENENDGIVINMNIPQVKR